MKRREYEELVELVVDSHLQQANCSLKANVSHFTELGFSRSTICRIVKKYSKHGTTGFFPKSSRPTKTSGQKLKVLVKSVNNKTGISQRKRAVQFGISQSIVSRTFTLPTPSCSDRTWPALITLAKCKHSELPIESIM